MSIRFVRRIAFKVRWWKWFLSFRTPLDLYTSRAHIDKQSREIVWDRREREWQDREPKWSEE